MVVSGSSDNTIRYVCVKFMAKLANLKSGSQLKPWPLLADKVMLRNTGKQRSKVIWDYVEYLSMFHY